jgi:hypothetical protein
MTRRMALAAALAFTTIVTFSVVVFGAQHGVFSDKKASRQAVAEPPADTPEPEATATRVPPPAPLAPVVLTRYVYVDDPAPEAAAPPAAAAAASPPTAAPAASPTRAASPTAQPSATPTTLPPTATPAASAPAQSQSTELEFVGTVTAIDGNVVTFSHEGQLTAVQVGNPSSLTVGTTAHVHAILKSGAYVATEIEAGG